MDSFMKQIKLWCIAAILTGVGVCGSAAVAKEQAAVIRPTMASVLFAAGEGRLDDAMRLFG